MSQSHQDKEISNGQCNLNCIYSNLILFKMFLMPVLSCSCKKHCFSCCLEQSFRNKSIQIIPHKTFCLLWTRSWMLMLTENLRTSQGIWLQGPINKLSSFVQVTTYKDKQQTDRDAHSGCRFPNKSAQGLPWESAGALCTGITRMSCCQNK